MNNSVTPGLNSDWEIAKWAESRASKISTVAEAAGIRSTELIPYGNQLAKIDYQQVLTRLADQKNAKYICVSAINPTPLGEGKSTTTIGLVQGLAKRGKRPIATLRQPSGGPTMNIKGSAAGGGLSQVIPLTPFSLGLTGDINALMNAHNLAMVALTSRIQHEFNYTDEELAQKKISRLNIDHQNLAFNWVIDFCAQSLRKIVIGLGDKMNGLTMESGFNIAVSSEIMAILAMTTSLADFRKKMARIIVAYDKQGNPVTTDDLEVAGAMTAWMLEALKPNLLQTIEGQPVLVHAGPFANIAIGQSSIIADKLATKLGDYLVTESGFGADIGFEKFWNLKCRCSELTPNAAVIVATIRALKCHGGAPIPVPGRPIPEEYAKENLTWVEQGCKNLIHHLNTIKLSGITPVVCLNEFLGDTKSEIAMVKSVVEQAGGTFAKSNHWLKGGAGALELADAVIDACSQKTNFKFLYDPTLPVFDKIKTIAQKVYGATDITLTETAQKKLHSIQNDDNLNQLGICMVKTHLSLTNDPTKKGAPKNWTLPISDFLIYRGAGLLCPVAGSISLMPGTSSKPAFSKIDVDVNSGAVIGLF